MKQPARQNVENSRDGNMIDPMTIEADRHDRFPKSDLDGRYFGEGLPLCDEMTATSKGAEYHLVSFLPVPTFHVLDDQSPLFKALCGGEEECTPQATVVLQESLPCSGVECRDISIVKVGSAFYQYHTAPCAHFFFDSSTENETANETDTRRFDGSCRVQAPNRRRNVIRSGLVQLDGLNESNTPEREASCLAKCRAFGGTGCYLRWSGECGLPCAHGGEPGSCRRFRGGRWLVLFVPFVGWTQRIFLHQQRGRLP